MSRYRYVVTSCGSWRGFRERQAAHAAAESSPGSRVKRILLTWEWQRLDELLGGNFWGGEDLKPEAA